MKQIQKATTKKMKLYLFCRNTITILLTIAIMIPFIYLLGSDQSFYSEKPLYEAYAKNPYFEAKVSEVEAALNSSLIVNIYSQQAHEKKQSSMRQWEHLREFVSYLGYHFNENGLLTVDRLITPPEIKQQKKGKGTQNSGNQRLLEYAYSLENFGEMNALRNKINKAASGIITRLKIKSKVSKSANLAENLKNKIVGEVLGNKVWLITIHPDFWQFHSSEELRKQLTTLSKQRQKDRFIVISIGPADPEWKKMKNVSINLEETVISSMKDSFKDIISNYFTFQINATRVIQTILCQSQASLFQLNNFLHRCNTSFSCYNSIKIFRKEKVKKGDKNTVRSYVDQLCQQGQISQDDSDFIKILRDLGFAPIEESQNQEIQNNLKVYYEIANGKKCKGNKRCNFEWLETSKPLNDTNIKVEEAVEQVKPVIKEQEEEIQPIIVETTKPNKTKTQEKKPSTKTKKEGKGSNTTKATKATLSSNEANENETTKQVKKEQKEQKPSKIKSKSNRDKSKATKSQNTFSAEVKSKEQVKTQNKKADKNKVKKQVKTQSKGKKDKKIKATNPEEIPKTKDVESSKDQQANNVVTITSQINEEVKDTKIVSEVPAESNEESAKEQVAATQKTEEPASPDAENEQVVDIQPENTHFDVAEIPCDNQDDKTCQSIPSDNEEQPAKQIHEQAASPAQQGQDKQVVAEQTPLASEEALPTNENPTIQLKDDENIEEVPEAKEIIADSEQSNPETVEEVEQVAVIAAESPETTEDIIEVTNQPSAEPPKDTQGTQSEQATQKTESDNTPPASNDQSL